MAIVLNGTTGITTPGLINSGDSTVTGNTTFSSSSYVGIGLTPTSRNNAHLQLLDGIAFPATQVPSSDANVLDDYEEGTCTIYVSDGTRSSTSASCSYTKIGRMVTVIIPLYGAVTTSFSTTSQLSIRGLPFTIANILEGMMTSPNASNTPVMCEGGAGLTYFGLYKPNGSNPQDWASLTLTTLGASAGALISFYGTITYFTS